MTQHLDIKYASSTFEFKYITPSKELLLVNDRLLEFFQSKVNEAYASSNAKVVHCRTSSMAKEFDARLFNLRHFLSSSPWVVSNAKGYYRFL